jgi:hypothetical protein
MEHEMSIELLTPVARAQAQIYALQAVTTALLVRHFQRVGDVSLEANIISDIVMRTVGKFDLRGGASQDEKDAARALMESVASETIAAAATSAQRMPPLA